MVYGFRVGWRLFLVCVVCILADCLPVRAGGVVVVSIKPLHSLVAGVMLGVGVPQLLISGKGSPHAYSLKPSQARMLQNAGMIFWLGPALEGFLEKPLAVLTSKADVAELLETPGMERLKVREGGDFELHDEDVDAHQPFDPHIWLDPQNASRIVMEITGRLARNDPANRQVYLANAMTVQTRLTILEAEITGILAPVKQTRFVVFHDAFQYFEKRFGLKASGSLTSRPNSSPGAGRITRMRKKLSTSDVACIFTEPQFSTRLVETVAEGMNVKRAVLDPLGSGQIPGQQMYFEMMLEMAGEMRDCLGK